MLASLCSWTAHSSVREETKFFELGQPKHWPVQGKAREVGAHLGSQLQGEEAVFATQPFLRVGRENKSQQTDLQT